MFSAGCVHRNKGSAHTFAPTCVLLIDNYRDQHKKYAQNQTKTRTSSSSFTERTPCVIFIVILIGLNTRDYHIYSLISGNVKIMRVHAYFYLPIYFSGAVLLFLFAFDGDACVCGSVCIANIV